MDNMNINRYMSKKSWDKWGEIEERLNNLFWHLRVCEESGKYPCRGVLYNELNIIKSNYDYIDNH